MQHPFFSHTELVCILLLAQPPPPTQRSATRITVAAQPPPSPTSPRRPAPTGSFAAGVPLVFHIIQTLFRFK